MSYFFNGSSFIIWKSGNTILHINICYKTICSSFNMNTFYSYKTMLCSNNSQSQLSLVLSATIKQSKPNMTCILYPLRSRHPLILSWFWMYNVICISQQHTKRIQIFMCFLQINHYHYRVSARISLKEQLFELFNQIAFVAFISTNNKFHCSQVGERTNQKQISAR